MIPMIQMIMLGSYVEILRMALLLLIKQMTGMI